MVDPRGIQFGDPLAPLPSSILGTSSVQAAVRPRRLAFAVTNGDLGGLRRAILGASTIWGGARSPILPVVGGNRILPGAAQVASFLHIDDVLDYRRHAKRPLQLGELDNNLTTVRPEPALDDVHFWTPHPMAVNDAEAIRQRRLLRAPGGEMAFLAALGDVALPDEAAWWRQRGAQILDTTDASSIAWAQANGETVLDATLSQDVDRTVVNPLLTTMALVVVAKNHRDFQSIVAFWNFRALRPRSGPDRRTILILEDMAFDDGVANAIRKTATGGRSEPSLGVFSDTLSADWLRARIRDWGIQLHTGAKFTEKFSDVEDAPATARVLDPRSLWLVPRSPGEVISVPVSWQRPTTQIRFQSPVRWNFENTGFSRTQVLLAGEQFNVPRLPAVARTFHRDAVWEHDRLRMAGASTDIYEFSISLPSGREVLDAVLAERGAAATASDKAIQIQGAVSLVLNPGIFLSRSIVRAIQALSTPGSRDLRRLLESDLVEADAKVTSVMHATAPAVGLDFSAVQGRIGEPIPKRVVSEALDSLVRNSVVDRGFQTSCDLCGLRLFSDLSSGTRVPACAGCGQVANLVSGDNGQPAIHYRLKNLGHRLSLNGGLAPLAAMQLLLAEGAFVLPGANVTQSSASLGEFDLLGWHGQTVFAGEAKTSLGGLAEFNLLADAARAAAVGANQYLLVCLEKVDSKTADRAEIAAADAGLTLRILDPRTLFPSSD